MVYRKDFLLQLGGSKGRSFLHDLQHGVYKVLPAITGLATLINKIGMSSAPETWVGKAVDYLKTTEGNREYIQEDLDVGQPEDYTWQELYAYKKSGYKLNDSLEKKLAKEMDQETRKFEYQQATPDRISETEKQSTQYQTAVDLYVKRYIAEINKFLKLSDAEFNSQKRNIRLREINITRDNYRYKSKELDDLLATLRAKLGQVGGGLAS